MRKFVSILLAISMAISSILLDVETSDAYAYNSYINSISIEKKHIIKTYPNSNTVYFNFNVQGKVIQSGNISYKLPNGSYVQKQIYLDSNTNLYKADIDGIFMHNAGLWEADNIMLNFADGTWAILMDYDTNGSYWGNAQLDEANFYTYDSDKEGPVFESIEVSNNSISKGESVTLTLNTSDLLSDIQKAIITYFKPNGEQITLKINQWDNIGGNRYKGTIDGSYFDKYGNYECVLITIYDTNWNTTSILDKDYYNGSSQTMDLTDADIKVMDNEAPTLEYITVDKKEVGKDERVQVTVKANDESGVKSIYVSYQPEYDSLNRQFRLENMGDGVFTGEISSDYIDNCYGLWRPSLIMLEDNNNNEISIWSKDIYPLFGVGEFSQGDFYRKEFKVEGLDIDNESATLKVGDSFKINTSVYPYNAENKNVYYESSNDAVANVDGDGNIFAVGEGQVEITVKTLDGGYSKYCKITVKSNEKPIIVAEDIVIKIGDSFDARSIVSASDKEDGDITSKIKIIENTVDTQNPGKYKVVYSVEDSDGNIVTKEIIVTVNPKLSIINNAPVITAEDSTLKVGDKFDVMSGVSASDKEDGDLTSKIKVLENTVDTTKVGEYKVVYKITDSQGASATKTVKVVIRSNEKSVITAKDVVLTVGDKFDAMVGVSALDKEDGDLTSKIKVLENTVDTQNPGKYKVVYSVEDSDGNIVTKEVSVTVNPKWSIINNAPTITAKDITLKVGDKFDAMVGVSASDKEDGDLTSKIKVLENTVDTTKVGEYKVVYKVTDSQGASATKTVKVAVKSNEKPVITAKDVVLTVGDKFDAMVGVSALDKEDGDLISKIKIVENTVDTQNPGKYKVVYSVEDSDGNIVTKEVSVTVNSKWSIINNAPTITVKDITLKVGDKFDAMSGVSASDKEDGDLTSKIKVLENTVDTTKVGEYKVVYKITDSQGASATKTIKVLVRSNEKPVITAKDVVLTVGDKFNVMSGVSALDKEDGNIISKIKIVENTVNILKAGKYKVVYSVTDNDGNLVKIERIITVNAQKIENVKASPASYNSNKVSWSKVSGANGYEVWRSTSKNGTYKKVKIITNGNTLSYANSSLETGTTYYYKVRGYRTVNGSKVYSNYSGVVSAKPVLSKLSVTLTAGTKKATVKWKKISGSSGYEVYRSSSKSGKYTNVKTIAKGFTVSFTNSSLTKNKTYYYKVRAYRLVNGKKVYSSYSSIKSVKIK